MEAVGARSRKPVFARQRTEAANTWRLARNRRRNPLATTAPSRKQKKIQTGRAHEKEAAGRPAPPKPEQLAKARVDPLIREKQRFKRSATGSVPAINITSR
jgi:hypothetical protein